MTEKEKYKLSTYISDETIRETKYAKAELVSSSLDGQKYIKKTYHSDKRAVFNVLADIKNAHIPEIYEIFFGEDTIVIEQYIPGETLEELISQGKTFSKSQVRTIFNDLLDAIDTLHKNNIIHRDIKPANVIITEDGRAVLIDYSIARPYSDKRDNDTELFGTVGYAAPEQFGFSQSDPRTDIYAFGLTIKKIADRRNASGKLCKAIGRCTEFDPSRRFQSADEIRRYLVNPQPAVIAISAAGIAAAAGAVFLLLPKSNEPVSTGQDIESSNHQAEQTQQNEQNERTEPTALTGITVALPTEEAGPTEETISTESPEPTEEATSAEQTISTDQAIITEQTIPTEQTETTEPPRQTEPVDSDNVIYEYDSSRIVNTSNSSGVPCIQIWGNGIYEAEISIGDSVQQIKLTAEKRGARCSVTIGEQRFEFEDTYSPEALSYTDTDKIAEIIFYDLNGDDILEIIPVICDGKAVVWLDNEVVVLKNYALAWCIFGTPAEGFKTAEGAMLAEAEPFKIYDTTPGCLWSSVSSCYKLENGQLVVHFF